MEDRLTVGMLIEKLQEIDPKTPIHNFGGCGEFPPKFNIYKATLMQSKNDPTYYAMASDPMWNNKQFHKPFLAVIL